MNLASLAWDRMFVGALTWGSSCVESTARYFSTRSLLVDYRKLSTSGSLPALDTIITTTCKYDSVLDARVVECAVCLYNAIRK
jgi:hypothetical protein